MSEWIYRTASDKAPVFEPGTILEWQRAAHDPIFVTDVKHINPSDWYGCESKSPISRYRVVYTEADPQGKDPHEGGAKLDSGKNELSLVIMSFANALWEVGQVGTYGAEKYTRDGWVQVDDGQYRYTNAMLRHLLKEGTSEQIDPDTGLRHAAHTAWNALARLELMIRKEKGGM